VLDRLEDLSEIPSPYLAGNLMPIIQTRRGCPFLCTFCMEANTYYSRKHRRPSEMLQAEIDVIGQWIQAARSKGGLNDLHIADSDWGMYKDDLEASQFIADAIERWDWPNYIICSTGKNQHERVMEASRIVDGRIRVSGSVQSTNADVLEKIKGKNVKIEHMLRLAEDANAIGAASHSEVMLGLPGDSLERHMSDLLFDEPQECRFVLRGQQIDSIERALNTYGRDLPAMTKIVSFLRVESFYREFERVA